MFFSSFYVRLARVGLGALGVVSEVTLQLMPEHQLMEHTYVASAQVLLHLHLLPSMLPSLSCNRAGGTPLHSPCTVSFSSLIW